MTPPATNNTRRKGTVRCAIYTRKSSEEGLEQEYLVLRSDAVDVVYGTVEGYEALGIPYMPHIAPDKRWQAGAMVVPQGMV